MTAVAVTTEDVAAGAATAEGIRVQDAVKIVDGIRILDAVSFVARPGRITALLGPNGAGKSTVLGALGGQVRLNSGTASVDGKPLARHRHPIRVVGTLPPAETLHPGRSAAGVLRAVAAVGRIRSQRVAEVLQIVGLGELADVRVGEMSLGMRQRLALAVALLAEPRILILDEPHNGLDAAAIRWLREVLRRYADSGRTVLIASHLLGELQDLAHDVVVLAGGRVTESSEMAEVVRSRAGGSGSAGRLLEEWYFEAIGEGA